MNKKPIVLVVMDGVGINSSDYGNAVSNAYTPTLDSLFLNSPNTQICAHGTAVGLPSDDDMGNSEVGHNALGCGQVYSQGAKLVNESIENKKIFESETWHKLVETAVDHSMHFIGLLSDGNVHSHIKHLKALVAQAKVEKISKVYLHVLLDGRDVPATSGLIYLEDINAFINEVNSDDFTVQIASGGGRMAITMDRYQANWSMVEKGWHTHVLGNGRQFDTAVQAVETFRAELGCDDQDLPAFVIAKDGVAVGTINDGDAVVLTNFRGDRAIEISKAFDEANFDQFDRVRFPKTVYAGMLQYDGDLQIPTNYLVTPPAIKNTLSEYLVAQNVKSYAISETQKFGHMTYFWNGNNSSKFSDELETWVEVTSDVVPFEQRPWMKAAEVTDLLVEAIEAKEFDFLRVNYPNGDMVGHTGNYAATIVGVETVDLMLARVLKACDKADAICLITADHGNADEMYEKAKKVDSPIKPKTAHTLNKVPFIIYNADVQIKEGDFGLSNVAKTVVDLMELEGNSSWDESLIK